MSSDFGKPSNDFTSSDPHHMTFQNRFYVSLIVSGEGVPGGYLDCSLTAAEVLRGLRTVLALPFAPLSSAGLQQRQVAEIASRMHRYQDTWHGGLRCGPEQPLGLERVYYETTRG